MPFASRRKTWPGAGAPAPGHVFLRDANGIYSERRRIERDVEALTLGRAKTCGFPIGDEQDEAGPLL